MELNPVLENAFYLLAVMNPASKILFLSSYEPPLSKGEIFELSWKSSLAALCILVLTAVTGGLVLTHVFRVSLYSLQITGGAVVFMIGWTAVREGVFSVGGSNVRQTLFDVSIVPLATPLIAGPGMLAATITMSAETGLPVMLFALASAIAINFVLMVFSWRINRLLKLLHMTGPLIRFAGLITAAIAVQMMISGFKTAFS